MSGMTNHAIFFSFFFLNLGIVTFDWCNHERNGKTDVESIRIITDTELILVDEFRPRIKDTDTIISPFSPIYLRTGTAYTVFQRINRRFCV
jgi:hypothetical protein